MWAPWKTIYLNYYALQYLSFCFLEAITVLTGDF